MAKVRTSCSPGTSSTSRITSWTSSTAEAAACSRARREALAQWPHPLAHGNFAWVIPPVLNPFTRLAVEMCAADGTLRVIGYERQDGSELPRPATEIRELTKSFTEFVF